MIIYDPFWKTLKAKGVSSYRLNEEYGISNGTIHKMRTNQSVTVYTINKFCKLLNCEVSDIMQYIPDEENVNIH